MGLSPVLPAAHDLEPDVRPVRGHRALAALEVALATACILLDLLIPSLVLLLLAVVSLLVRRDHPGSLGLVRLRRPGGAALQVLGLAVAWTLLQLALLMPLAEHLTGERQDVSDFAEVEGNLPLLLALVAASWTLAAVVEEVAFRGFLFTRLREALGAGRLGLVAAAVGSAALFGLVHTEQGLVGVLLTTFDALFFTWLRLRYASLWAGVLAHGFTNTIGLTTFFLIGPVYALW